MAAKKTITRKNQNQTTPAVEISDDSVAVSTPDIASSSGIDSAGNVPVQTGTSSEGTDSPRPVLVQSGNVVPLVPSEPKPKRHRRSREEIEAERQAEERTRQVQSAALEEQKRLRVEAFVKGLVETTSILCGKWLPPAFDDHEQALLMAAWVPVVMLYESQVLASPWWAAGFATATVLGPRVASKLQARRGLRVGSEGIGTAAA